MNPTRLFAWLCAFAAMLVIFSTRADIWPLEITDQPQSLSLYECQFATFNVGFTGTLESVSWYRDGILKTNALSYALPERVTLGESGSEFYVVLSNSFGSVTSEVATLIVTTDPLPFRVASVINCPDQAAGNYLLLSFATCPPLSAAEVTNVANYRTSYGFAYSADWVGPTNVLLRTTPIVQGYDMILTVTNIRDLHGTYISPDPIVIPYVSATATNFVVSVQPFHTTNSLILQGAPVTLQFLVQGITPCSNTNDYASVSYQWQRRYVTNSFTNVVGATGSTYSFSAYMPFCWGGDVEYRALAFANGLTFTSSVATVRAVVDDGFPPFLESARCTTLFSNQVTLAFRGVGHYPNLASATNPALYSINHGVTVLAARYGSNWFGPDYTEIVLTTTPLTNNAFHIVTVTNIQGFCEFPPEQLAFVNRAPVTLLGPHAASGHNYIYFEAEDYDANISPGSGRWWRLDYNYTPNPVISGHHMEASAAPSSLLTNSWHLDYHVNFPSAGKWYVWVRGRSQGTSGSAIWVGLDGTPTSVAGNGVQGWNNTNWRWTGSNATGRTMLTVTNAGLHQFSLWAYTNSDFTFVDSILLTTNVAFSFMSRSMVWTNEVVCTGVANPKPDVCLWPPPRESTLDQCLQSRHAGSNLELTWPAGGVLQETTNAPVRDWFYYPLWRDVTNATSPLIVSNGPTRFFRVKFF